MKLKPQIVSKEWALSRYADQKAYHEKLEQSQTRNEVFYSSLDTLSFWEWKVTEAKELDFIFI
jgi:hypothetical protein